MTVTERESLERLAAAVAPGRVVFAGSVPDPVPALEAADVLVLASRGGDSMPAVLIEAGLAGLPTIATPVQGIPEIVVDEVTGILVPIDETDALTSAIIRLTSDPRLAARLGAEARRRCSSHFAIDVVAAAVRGSARPGSRRDGTLVIPPRGSAANPRAHAVMITPYRAKQANGPNALWVESAGWAEAAAKRFGSSIVVSPDGVFTADEAKRLVFPDQDKPFVPRLRRRPPEVFVTAAKDVRLLRRARRFDAVLREMEQAVDARVDLATAWAFPTWRDCNSPDE